MDLLVDTRGEVMRLETRVSVPRGKETRVQIWITVTGVTSGWTLTQVSAETIIISYAPLTLTLVRGKDGKNILHGHRGLHFIIQMNRESEIILSSLLQNALTSHNSHNKKC